MDVKIVYWDGSSEIFRDAQAALHSKDHNIFRIEYKKNAIMIPDRAVRSVGGGRVEEIYTVANGRTTKTEEVFVYE